MGIIKLEKTVLSVRNRAEKFLNGLSANTLEQPRNAFLDKNGKIIATFDQIKIGDDEFLIVMAAGACSTVLEHLDRYIKLSKAIVEKKDSTDEQLALKEVNPSYLCYRADWLWNHLDKLGNNNAQGEYYLTDLVGFAFLEKEKINSVNIEPREALGVNTTEQLKLISEL